MLISLANKTTQLTLLLVYLMSKKYAMEKVCKQCGKTYNGTKASIVCSRQCYRDYKAQIATGATIQTCTKCHRTLPIESFAKRKYPSGIIGREKQCKECRSSRIEAFKQRNPDYKKQFAKPKVIKVCHKCNKEYEGYKNVNQKYCSKDCSIKEKVKYVHWETKECPYCHNLFESMVRLHKKYCSKQCAILMVSNPVPYKKRRESIDPAFRLVNQIRKKIYLTLRLEQKYARSLELLGCTAIEAREHIERQFTQGMTWDNWAIDGWHIDHIKPIASFDLSNEEQQRQCFHYTNLQPLWANDNYKKSDKIIEKQLILI
jgi:hypothetical protein